MDFWQIALFVAASLLALRSFVTLTNHHQRVTLRRLMQEERRAEQAAAEAGPPQNVAA